MGLEYVEYPVTEIERLEVNCKLFAIRVMGSATDKIELSWRDTTMRSLEVKQEGNTLKLIDHAAIGIYGTLALINLKKDDQLLIKLPESFTGKAIIQSRSESVHLSDLKFPGNFGVSSDAGEILLENVETAKIDIRGNLCKVNCYGVGVTETLDIPAFHSPPVCLGGRFPFFLQHHSVCKREFKCIVTDNGYLPNPF